MKIRPLGNKVLLGLKKATTHKIGDKELLLVKKDDNLFRAYVEDLGPDVKSPLQKGDEVILFSSAHLNCHTEHKGKALVVESDIWGVVTNESSL